MTGKHEPEAEVPQVRIIVNWVGRIRPELKVFMGDSKIPCAFGELNFETSEGAKAFADSLAQHGVVGYAEGAKDPKR